MSPGDDAFGAGLQALVAARLPGAPRVEGLRRLSAGATLQTWAFDAVGAAGTHALILRRSPDGLRGHESLSLPLEAELLRSLGAQGLPVPQVVYTVGPEDGLGDGFLMARIEGETIARRILRDAAFAEVRPRLAAQLGAILGAIHGARPDRLPTLPRRSARGILDELYPRYQALACGRPVFELAFQWLGDHLPEPPARVSLVHGDFRNGNLIVGPEGVRAVLDWEMAHLGDGHEDIAWIGLMPWRFGQIDRPIGGIDQRAPFYRAYEASSGERVDPARVRFWEMMGSLRWGLGCAGMLEWFRGKDPTVERAMIARRASENEMDLIAMLAQHAGGAQ